MAPTTVSTRRTRTTSDPTVPPSTAVRLDVLVFVACSLDPIVLSKPLQWSLGWYSLFGIHQYSHHSSIQCIARITNTSVVACSIHTQAMSSTGNVQAFTIIIDFKFTMFTSITNVTSAGEVVHTINTLSSFTAVDVLHLTLINVHITDPSCVAWVTNTNVAIYSIHTLHGRALHRWCSSFRTHWFPFHSIHQRSQCHKCRCRCLHYQHTVLFHCSWCSSLDTHHQCSHHRSCVAWIANTNVVIHSIHTLAMSTHWQVYCGHYINQHMLSHQDSSGHRMVLSLADLSVWCFACDSHIDNQVSHHSPLRRRELWTISKTTCPTSSLTVVETTFLTSRKNWTPWVLTRLYKQFHFWGDLKISS